VLIGTGIALVIVLAMRSAATADPASAPAPDAVRPGTGSNDIPT
jgi:hypothetical protein